jgi:carbon monoxide dehydrogenase subunit G
MSLEFNGEYTLPVNLQKVWQGLNDPEVLRQSIRGCSELERVSDHEFQAVLVAKVGPIGVTFRGQVMLKDIVPLKSYTLIGQAKGGAAGFGSMSAHIQLESFNAENTLLRYSAQADVGGKLASVGQRLILSVAKKQADDFFQQLSAVLTGSLPQETRDNSSPVQHKHPPTEPGGIAGGWNAPVPAWLVVFVAVLGIGLGYCMALLP